MGAKPPLSASGAYNASVTRWWPIALSLGAACGRVGFDGVDGAGDAGASDAGIEVPADLATLPCETDQATLGALPASDRIRVVYSGGYPYVIDIHHVTNTQHDVHAYRLGQRDGVLVATDLGVIYALPDIAGIAIETIGTDHAMFITDPVDITTRLVRFDAEFATVSDTSLGSFAHAYPPYAKSSTGRLVVGSTIGKLVQARALDASFMPSAPAVTVAGTGNTCSIAPAGADFVVAWSSNGLCSFARVSAAGSVIAGPVTVDPGTTCEAPAVAMLGSGAFAYVVHDVTGNGQNALYEAFGGTLSATLLSATVPMPLGATPSYAEQLVVMGNAAYVPLSNNGTVSLVQLSDSTITKIGDDIGSVGYDALWLERVAGASVLFRIENQQLVVRRLCR
jgi:hypothetical protein